MREKAAVRRSDALSQRSRPDACADALPITIARRCNEAMTDASKLRRQMKKMAGGPDDVQARK
jgi:hypothetical protein